jgi:MFS family permease
VTPSSEADLPAWPNDGRSDGGGRRGLGYLVIARIDIASLDIWDYGTSPSISSLAKLLLICLVLFASFVAVGVMIATLLGRRADRIGRLYFADLFGAGLACAVVVSMLSFIGPVATIMLAGALLALTGGGVALRGGRRARSRAAPAGLALRQRDRQPQQTVALFLGPVNSDDGDDGPP